MMKLSCTFTKIPCVYTLLLYACIKQNEMVQHIYSLKTDNFEYRKPYLIQHKKARKRIFNKYNIVKCFQFNKVDFET